MMKPGRTEAIGRDIVAAGALIVLGKGDCRVGLGYVSVPLTYELAT